MTLQDNMRHEFAHTYNSMLKRYQPVADELKDVSDAESLGPRIYTVLFCNDRDINKLRIAEVFQV